MTTSVTTFCQYNSCSQVIFPGEMYCKAHAKMTARWRYPQRQGTTTERFGKGWKAISKRVLQRDRYVCHWCGGKATTADHLIARVNGGTNEMSNLVAACRPCNSRRGGRTRRVA